MSGDNNTAIPQIGFGPSSFGDYSNYMPSMMGITGVGSYGGMNSVFDPMTSFGAGMGAFDPMTSFGAGMYGGGMMGNMMNYMLEYQQNLRNMQNSLELNSLDHTQNMHSKMISNEVQAHEETLSGIAEKILADGAIQGGVMSLYSKIKEGDQNGVCQEYDKLKEYVYATYDKELKSKGLSIARAADARRLIENTYSQLISATAHDGEDHTLEGDIEKYCGNAFNVGFMSGFKGNPGQRYKAETINHIYGKGINNRSYQDHLERKGKIFGTICSGLKDIGVGGVEGAGLYALGVSAITLIAALCGCKGVSGRSLGELYTTALKGTKYFAALGIGVSGASDIIHRMNSRNAA